MKYNFTSVIAIAISVTSYVPIYDCTGVSKEMREKVIAYLKSIAPENTYTVVSTMGKKNVCKYHVNEIDWGF